MNILKNKKLSGDPVNINCVGLELDEAIRRLNDEGADCIICQISSRKGVENADSKRVIRQKLLPDGEHKTVFELAYSEFKTRV